MNIVLDILDPECKPYSHAEGAVIVNVNDGEFVADDARSLDEGGGLDGGIEGCGRMECL